MATDATSMVWFLATGVAAPVAFACMAARAPSARQLRRWAHGCGVTVTDSNRPLIRGHLGRVRRVRSLAALPLWWLWPAPLVFGAQFPKALASPAPALVAYAVGAVLAEVSFGPAPAGTLRRASLSPRRSCDYRPDWLRILPWALLTLTAASLLAPAWTRVSPFRIDVLVALVVGVAVTALASFATRHIVQRPQRTDDLDLLAADDGLRATAVAMTSSITLIAALTALTTSMRSALSWPLTTWASIVLTTVFVLCQALSLAALSCIVRQETWGYRHRHRQTLLVATP